MLSLLFICQTMAAVLYYTDGIKKILLLLLLLLLLKIKLKNKFIFIYLHRIIHISFRISLLFITDMNCPNTRE
jgi:hypothetical protein